MTNTRQATLSRVTSGPRCRFTGSNPTLPLESLHHTGSQGKSAGRQLKLNSALLVRRVMFIACSNPCMPRPQQSRTNVG